LKDSEPYSANPPINRYAYQACVIMLKRIIIGTSVTHVTLNESDASELIIWLCSLKRIMRTSVCII